MPRAIILKFMNVFIAMRAFALPEMTLSVIALHNARETTHA
jgi:hypothetical protein